MREITDGVQFLHSMKLKHKDIKLENILFWNESSIELVLIVTDFGISKVYGLGAPTNYTDSTYSWLAPEQIARSESSLKSDIWLLGCCFGLLFAKSIGGSRAVDALWLSFVDPPGAGIIADEFGRFSKVLDGIASQGTERHHLLYKVILSMLELDPSTRCDAAWA